MDQPLCAVLVLSLSREKQPSYLSRCWDDQIPFLTCPHHAVEYGQQLPHARGEGYLLRFTGFQQALVELTQYRVATTRH